MSPLLLVVGPMDSSFLLLFPSRSSAVRQVPEHLATFSSTGTLEEARWPLEIFCRSFPGYQFLMVSDDSFLLGALLAT